MRHDLDFRDRAYVANLLRRRAIEGYERAESGKQQRVKDEWLTEARHAEQLAEQMDAGEVEPETSEVTRLRDIEAVGAKS
jgi:hypothetical protein